MAVRLYLQDFVAIDHWVVAKLGRAPGVGEMVQVVRGTKPHIPATIITHPDPDTYLIEYGDRLRIRHSRNGQVIINIHRDLDQQVAAVRIGQFTPFEVKYRGRDRFYWTVSLPREFGIEQFSTYYYANIREYTIGWELGSGIRLSRTDGKWVVTGALTIEQAKLAALAREGLRSYVTSYLDSLKIYRVRLKCPTCDIESDGKPMADIIDDPTHWQEHIARRQHPQSLVCRLVHAIPDLRLKKEIALLVNRCFGPTRYNADSGRLFKSIEKIELGEVETEYLRKSMTDYLTPRIEPKPLNDLL
jgi:hypothetical protein